MRQLRPIPIEAIALVYSGRHCCISLPSNRLPSRMAVAYHKRGCALLQKRTKQPETSDDTIPGLVHSDDMGQSKAESMSAFTFHLRCEAVKGTRRSPVTGAKASRYSNTENRASQTTAMNQNTEGLTRFRAGGGA